MNCPTCGSPWANPAPQHRVKDWRGPLTIAEAARHARVSRVTWSRVEAGTRVSWPNFWAVLSLAGISREDAMVAWAEAKPQKLAKAEAVYEKALPHVLAAEKTIRDATPAPVIIITNQTSQKDAQIIAMRAEIEQKGNFKHDFKDVTVYPVPSVAEIEASANVTDAVVNVLPEPTVKAPKKPWGQVHSETARAIKAREEAREAAEQAGQAGQAGQT